MSDLQAQAHAIDTRVKLCLSSLEFVDVYKAILTFGITCVKRPLESDISGAALRTDNVQVILVNSSKTRGHQNFTIAHEIYHCLYESCIENRPCSVELFSSRQSSERTADLFATYLLMPGDGIFHQLKQRQKIGCKLSLADVVHLEQYFGVSRKAMCWRLEQLKLIKKKETDEYSSNVRWGARLLGKSIELHEPSYEKVIISDYAEKAKEALEKQLITQARYEEILSDAALLEPILETEDSEIAD